MLQESLLDPEALEHVESDVTTHTTRNPIRVSPARACTDVHECVQPVTSIAVRSESVDNRKEYVLLVAPPHTPHTK